MPFNDRESRHKPCSESYMSRTWKVNTICQLLRETYALTEDPTVRLNLRIAVSMAKAMQRKLKGYALDWDRDGFW
jgi:hypothetical protein